MAAETNSSRCEKRATARGADLTPACFRLRRAKTAQPRGSARASQAESRGFEPHRPLLKSLAFPAFLFRSSSRERRVCARARASRAEESTNRLAPWRADRLGG